MLPGLTWRMLLGNSNTISYSLLSAHFPVTECVLNFNKRMGLPLFDLKQGFSKAVVFLWLVSNLSLIYFVFFSLKNVSCSSFCG